MHSSCIPNITIITCVYATFVPLRYQLFWFWYNSLVNYVFRSWNL